MTKSLFYLCSNFSQIFNVDRFISHLAEDVRIIKELPLKEGKTWIPYNMRVPRKCNESCYVDRVLPNLIKRHVSYYNLVPCTYSPRFHTSCFCGMSSITILYTVFLLIDLTFPSPFPCYLLLSLLFFSSSYILSMPLSPSLSSVFAKREWIVYCVCCKHCSKFSYHS